MTKQKSVLEKNPALADISIEEIEELLKEKKAAEDKAAKAKRENYEARKEDLINSLGGFAVVVRDMMIDLKFEAFKELTLFREEMLEYGELRGKEKNKGSFQLRNENYRIEFSSQVNKSFDERAELAESKLKEFLGSFVKKANANSYKIIMALLERNEKTNDFDVNLINRLYKMEKDFDNPLWVDAIKLFKESYSPYGTAQYIKFSEKNHTTNSWEPVVLDFAKLKTPLNNMEPDTETTNDSKQIKTKKTEKCINETT